MQPIRVKTVQESDLRMLGDLARNIQRVLPVTQADIDAAAALGKGWVVWKVFEVTDPLDNLRGGTQLVIKQNSITPGQNVRRVLIVQNPGGQMVVIGPAPSPLLLPDAIANSLHYVKAFGGTQQNGVPQEYTRLDRLQGDGDAYIDLGITLNQDDEIEVDFIFKYVSGGQIFGYRESASAKNITLFSGSGAGSIFMDFNDSGYTDYRLGTTGTDDAQYTAKISKTKRALYSGTTEIIANNTACPDTFTTGNALLFFAGGNPSGTAKFTGSILEVRIKDRMHLVPAKRNSDNVLGMYDMITGQFFTNTAESGAFIAGDPMVPTPAYPADIVSNNGALKVGRNLFDRNDPSTTINAYVGSSSVGSLATIFSSINDRSFIIKTKPNTKYTIQKLGGDTPYNRFRISETDSFPTIGQQVTKLYEDAETTSGLRTATITTGNNGNYIIVYGLNGSPSTELPTFLDNFVVCEGDTINVGQIYTDGTVETIKDSLNNTATAEMLLKVGSYQDVQSILDGVVTRKVGVKVLDGTEDIGKSGMYNGSFFVRNVVSDWGASNNTLVYCSHFSGVTEDTDYVQNKCIILNNAFNMWWASDSTPTVAQFTQWLADQYNAGTPVIVVYPLATETTESVTGQTLQVQAGNNTLEITQASLSGLELEAEYEKNA